MRAPLAAVAIAFVLAACDSTPKDFAGFCKAAVDKSRPQEKLDMLSKARQAPGDKAPGVPSLVALLKDAPAVKARAASMLADIKDPSAIQPLIDAIDYNVGASSDRSAREANDANKEIAKALGALKAKQAVNALAKLTSSRDNYAQVAAVEALGDIGDPGGVQALMQLATNDDIEPFTAKKAIMALGRIGDAEAAPAIMKMMFRERKGVSFFAEASFAAFQIGQPMAAPLLAVLKGEDKDLKAWAADHHVADAALFAKAAQVLGDLDDKRAVPVLIQRLAYSDPGDETLTYAVRLMAAESLGRLRAKEAVKALGEGVNKDPMLNAKLKYSDALIWIGDRDALPYLMKGAVMPPWDNREGPLTAIALIGDDRELKFMEDAKKSEPGRVDKECKELQASAAECTEEKKKDDAKLAEMIERLHAAKQCKADLACWTGKLKDKSAVVRERAALEVGRNGGPAQAQSLVDAIVAPATNAADLNARFYALLALNWVAGRNGGLAGETGKVADRLDALVEAEKGKAFTIKVDEDVKRLAIKLRRKASKA